MGKRGKKNGLELPPELKELTLRVEKQPQGSYVVTSPTLRGLFTVGDTLMEAIINLRGALESALDCHLHPEKYW